MGPGPASTATGAHPQVKVPARDPGPSRGPWEQHESNTGQNPWTFLLPLCPSTSTKAKAAVTPSPSSPTAEKMLSLLTGTVFTVF